ncbi:hypothetical protein [Streptomyces sp. CBG33]|uniref:hypothetical protein n=1 Tax=Streptomyces sp. CBG33 TaxID=2762624 RepID=UPI00164937DB|nr:hypothetical protein [Streptomyces sp. CBG33]
MADVTPANGLEVGRQRFHEKHPRPQPAESDREDDGRLIGERWAGEFAESDARRQRAANWANGFYNSGVHYTQTKQWAAYRYREARGIL